MTQRPLQGEQRGDATVYDDNDARRTAPLGDTYSRGGGGDRDVEFQVNTPTDRVRWGPILAGLFTALTTGLLLTLLALALGLGAYDQTSTARSFGIGSAITAALIWLIAFGIGGYVAARTAAFPGRSNGIFNGLMVGIVGIPLLLWGLTSIIGGLLGTAGSIAGTVATAAAPVAGQAAENPQAQASASAAAEGIQASASAAAQQVQEQLQQVDPEQVASNARNAALGALAPLALGLAASATGGAMGARKREERHLDVDA